MFSENPNLSPNYIHSKVSDSLSTSTSTVTACLAKQQFKLNDLPSLISPAAETYIEQLATKSQALTRQRFGNTIQLFIPLYLSNECYNSCSYCGFSYEHKYPRKTLSDNEIIEEAQYLSKKGFQHILLLTGESPKKVGVDYISHAITLIRPYFASIGIEIQPLNTAEYSQLIKAGADSISLYQETYHPESYTKHHTFGIKRQYKKRLNALEHAAKAGFHRINLGSLLGLYDWRYEAIALAEHIQYMMKHYWTVKYGVSFPRIKDMFGSFNVPYTITDLQLVQLITSFRLIFPDLNITLSTRESATFRDHIVSLGITTLSAESKTSPGGYCSSNAEEQFSTSDHRNLQEIKLMLSNNQLDPVQKDWDLSLMAPA